MSETLLISIIGAIQGVMVALIGKIVVDSGKLRKGVAKAGEDAAAARDQVENNHSTNFREDTDAQHEAVLKAISGLGGEVREVKRDIGGIRQEVREDRIQARNNFQNNHEAITQLAGRLSEATGEIKQIREELK